MSSYGKRLNRLFREQKYHHIEATLREPNRRSDTVTSAVREMKLRGFSSSAIEQDLFELGISHYVDVYSDFGAPVHPLSHYPFCQNQL